MIAFKQAISPFSLKFRLRTALVVPLVLQITAAVGLVGYLSYRNGQQAVNQLASQLRIEVASRTEQVLEDYFKVPHQITHSNINALRLNQINLQNKETMEQYLLYQLQVFPTSRENFVGLPDGSFIYAGIKEDGTFISSSTSRFPTR